MHRVAVLILACASVVFSAAGLSPAQPSSTTTPATRPARVPRDADDAVTPVAPGEPTRKRHEQFLKDKQGRRIDLLFIGDSITDYWASRHEASWQRFAPYRPMNFGLSGHRTEHVLWRIEQGEIDGITPNPKVVVLLIGTNNVAGSPDERPEWVAAGIQRIIERIHAKLPDSKVLLMGIFPRNAPDDDRRTRVRQVNTIISRIPERDPRVRYLGLWDEFLNPDGTVPKDVMPDGLHPGPKGYDIWYEAMKPALKEMMK